MDIIGGGGNVDAKGVNKTTKLKQQDWEVSTVGKITGMIKFQKCSQLKALKLVNGEILTCVPKITMLMALLYV